MTTITESRAAARPLALSSLVAAMAGRFGAYRRSRRILREFAAMEDHMLKDIGLTRADVLRATLAEPGADRMAMLGRARNRRMA